MPGNRTGGDSKEHGDFETCRRDPNRNGQRNKSDGHSDRQKSHHHIRAGQIRQALGDEIADPKA